MISSVLWLWKRMGAQRSVPRGEVDDPDQPEESETVWQACCAQRRTAQHQAKATFRPLAARPAAATCGIGVGLDPKQLAENRVKAFVQSLVVTFMLCATYEQTGVGGFLYTLNDFSLCCAGSSCDVTGDWRIR